MTVRLIPMACRIPRWAIAEKSFRLPEARPVSITCSRAVARLSVLPPSQAHAFFSVLRDAPPEDGRHGERVGDDHADTLTAAVRPGDFGARRAAPTIQALTVRIDTSPAHWRVSPMASPQ
jgi:hypothetical protein